MKQILVDTGAWDAIADSGDVNHESALLYRDKIVGQARLIVTNYVLDELYTLLLMNIGYRRTVTLKCKLDILVEMGILDVVWVSKEIEVEAWTIFERFNKDKQWSFTDCVSYAVMKRYGITEVFAFDHHFDQMGFTRRP